MVETTVCNLKTEIWEPARAENTRTDSSYEAGIEVGTLVSASFAVIYFRYDDETAFCWLVLDKLFVC